jgi:hypothetical protein
MSKSAKSHHPNQRALRRTANLDAVAAAIARADVGALCVGDGPTLMSGRAEITAMVRGCDCRPCTDSASLRTQAA